MENDSKQGGVVDANIAAARMITDTTGALHDYQAWHLKHWPLAVLEGTVSCEARVTIGDAKETEDGRGKLRRKNRPVSVEYRAVQKGRRPRGYKKKWAAGVKCLTVWTKELFWPDTEVRVFINNKEMINE